MGFLWFNKIILEPFPSTVCVIDYVRGTKCKALPDPCAEPQDVHCRSSFQIFAVHQGSTSFCEGARLDYRTSWVEVHHGHPCPLRTVA